MLSDVTLQSVSVKAQLKKKAEFSEVSVMTDPTSTREIGIDPLDKKSVSIGTEKEKMNDPTENITLQHETLLLMESMMNESVRTWHLFDCLETFHMPNLIKLQPIRTTIVTLLSSEEHPVIVLECGSAGRISLLLGERAHDSWCAHQSKVVINQRSKSFVLPMAVCPTCAHWSSQGMLAVGDLSGQITLISAEVILSCNSIHALAVTALEWISMSQLISCSSDGYIVLSQLKGTALEKVNSVRLSVSDLPRKIRKSSSSSKLLAVVSLNRSGNEVCIASETGGLWTLSLPDLRIKPIVSEPQAVERLLYMPPIIVTCGGNEPVKMVTTEGVFVDTLPLEATFLVKIKDFVIASNENRLIIYDITQRKIVCDEEKLIRNLNVSPQEEVIILEEKNRLVAYRITEQ